MDDHGMNQQWYEPIPAPPSTSQVPQVPIFRLLPLRNPSRTSDKDLRRRFFPEDMRGARIRQLFCNAFREDPWENELVKEEIPDINTAHWKIHQIFAESLFIVRDVKLERDAIQPVLALATRLLLTGTFIKFWETIFFGTVKTGSCGPQGPTFLHGEKFPILSPLDGDMTQERVQAVHERFLDLATRVRFVVQHGLELRMVRPRDSDEVTSIGGSRNDAGTRGKCNGIPMMVDGVLQSLQLISLNANFFEEILSFEGIEKIKNAGNRLHIHYAQFELATTLVHELVHAAWCDRLMLDKGTIDTSIYDVNNPKAIRYDPQFHDHLGFELGHAWENVVFGSFGGCKLSPYWKHIHRDEGVHCVRPGGDFLRMFGSCPEKPFWEAHCLTHRLGTLFRIPLKWYYRFFTDFFWKETRIFLGARAFKVPSTLGFCVPEASDSTWTAEQSRNKACSSYICQRRDYVHGPFNNVRPANMKKFLPLQTPITRLQQQQSTIVLSVNYQPRALDLRPVLGIGRNMALHNSKLADELATDLNALEEQWRREDTSKAGLQQMAKGSQGKDKSQASNSTDMLTQESAFDSFAEASGTVEDADDVVDMMNV